LARNAVERLYRFHAPVYDWTRWIFLHGRGSAARCLGEDSLRDVLEVGCGTGLNFRHVLRRVDPDRGSLVGLDFSADMLAKARRRRDRKGWNHVRLVRADASRMEFRRRFDAILFAYSLTMIPDWPRALERAHAHLTPGGRLVVLDFSTFDGWGPLKFALRAWLRLHHVETTPPYLARLREIFPGLEVRTRLGRAYFTAVGTKA
jgi:S-adenosylmethionine-diacylgycerolhomoserine-N-methlytransferase